MFILLALVVCPCNVVSIVDRTGQVDAHIDTAVFCLQVELVIQCTVVALNVRFIVHIIGVLIFGILQPFSFLPLLWRFSRTVHWHLVDALFVRIKLAVFALVALLENALQQLFAVLTNRGQFVRMNHKSVWNSNSVSQFFLHPGWSTRDI